MEEPNFIVAGFTNEMPGSIATICAKCGRKVFVSPSGQTFWAENSEYKVICASCVPDQPIETHPMTSEQLEELLEHGIPMEEIKAIADQFGVELPTKEG
jgi:hypothetical protein